MSLHRAVILGTGHALPEKVVTNADLEKIVDTSDEWITTRTGIRERRVAESTDYLSQYASAASRRALEAAGVAAADVDLLICATVTPDMPIPATACFIQEQLGASRGPAFDIQAGCSGFLYALSVARQFIATGQARTALVIGAELLTKYLNWEDRTTCVIFADGAGAVILGRGEEPYGILASALHTDGKMADFICLPGGGTRHPTTAATIREGMHFIRMKGNETFKLAVRSMEEVCREVTDEAGVDLQSIDLFIPHQANKRITDAVGSRLGIDEAKAVVNIERVGNTSAASIPIALDECVRDGRAKRGDYVLFAAFGAGLTWAASLVRWY